MKTARLSLAVAALLLADWGQAKAAPILGGQLFYTGGDVDVTVLSSTAGFSSDLQLYFFPSLASSHYIANNHTDLGQTFTLDAAFFNSNGISAGDELVFGIYVVNTGNTFLMGPSSRNLDGLAHNTVDVISTSPAYIANVGF